MMSLSSIACAWLVLGTGGWSAASHLMNQGGAGEQPRFHPAEGSAVLRRIEIRHDLSLEQMIFRVGDEQQAMPGSMAIASALELDVHDEYRRLDNGQLVEFRRTLDGVHLTGALTLAIPPASGAAARPEVRSLDKRSPLEGKSVVFQRTSSGHYGLHFDALEGDEGTLAHLTPHLDLAAFLPGRTVEIGDSWDVPIGALSDVFAPGGTWPWPRSRAEDPMFHRSVTSGMGGDLGQAFGGVEEGTLRMTWRGRGEGDGAHLGRMDMQVNVRLAKVQTDLVTSNLTSRERISNVRVAAASLSLEFEGTGLLTWDMEAERLSALTLDGRQRVRMRVVTRRGEEEPREQTLQMAGTLTVRVSTLPDTPRPVPGPR
jgi:hypothetical protein